MKNNNLPYEYSKQMEHKKWRQEIPYIQFPTDWKVQVTPPFGGAVVRFRVRKNNAEVSIYLDCYNNLGCCDEPYWEVFPYDRDCFRCSMLDIESLLNAITESISE